MSTNNTPLYSSSSWGNKVDVYENRIETRFLLLHEIIPISNIASITKPPLTIQADLILNSGEKKTVYPKNVKEFIEIVSELLSKKQ